MISDLKRQPYGGNINTLKYLLRLLVVTSFHYTGFFNLTLHFDSVWLQKSYSKSLLFNLFSLV